MNIIIKKIGLFHELYSRGSDSSDYIEYFTTPDNNYTFISLCDGSSSSFLANVAAETAAKVAVAYTSLNYKYGSLNENVFIKQLVEEIKTAVLNKAKTFELTIFKTEDVDTTCSLLIIDRPNNCCGFLSIGGTERLFSLGKDNINMLYATPEENSLFSENFSFSVKKSTLDNVKALFLLSDGAFGKLYRNTSFIEPYNTHIKEKNWQQLKKSIENTIFFDDATVIIIPMGA